MKNEEILQNMTIYPRFKWIDILKIKLSCALLSNNLLILMKCLYKLKMFQNSWSMKIPEMPVQIAVASLSKPSLIYQGKSNQLSVYTNNEVHNLPIRK